MCTQVNRSAQPCTGDERYLKKLRQLLKHKHSEYLLLQLCTATKLHIWLTRQMQTTCIQLVVKYTPTWHYLVIISLSSTTVREKSIYIWTNVRNNNQNTNACSSFCERSLIPWVHYFSIGHIAMAVDSRLMPIPSSMSQLSGLYCLCTRWFHSDGASLVSCTADCTTIGLT